MKPHFIYPLIFYIFHVVVYSQDNEFEISNIPPNLLENGNAIIRIDDTSVEISAQNRMIIKEKKAVTVLNKLGTQFSRIYAPFDENSKIKSIETFVYDALGNEIKKVKAKDYQDVSAVNGGTLYGDSRMLYYKYTPIAYPYTIYYEVEYETVNTGFVPSWNPVSTGLTAVETSTYNLICDPDLTLRFKEKNFEGFTIEKETSSNKLAYKLTNQVAFKNEPYCPLLENITPKLMVGLNQFSLEGINGNATNWSEFGKWQFDYLKSGNDQINESVKAQVKKLVEGVEDPILKAEIIYEYVQNRTRYISVQVGIGGWMPINANTVHRLGYGDCKGLSNYTKTLLDVVGVEAYYTIVWAGDEHKNVEKDFFSMQGNHVILNLPTKEGDIWLECTDQKVPFGYLGDFTEDRDVLVVTPSGGVIKHTKVYNSKENLQITTGSFEVDAVGSIHSKLKIESKGTQYIDNLHRNDGVSTNELEKSFKNKWSYINNIQFSAIEVFNNKDAESFEERIAFSAKNYVTQTGSEILVPINAFNKRMSTPSRVRDRKLPFEINYSYIDIDEIEIKLPATVEVLYFPTGNTINTKYGNYAFELEKINEHTFKYKRTIEIVEGKYKKEEYDLFRDFMKKIRKYDNSKIIIKQK